MQLSRLAPLRVSADVFVRSKIFVFSMFHVKLSVITFIQNACRFLSKTGVVDHTEIVKFEDFVILPYLRIKFEIFAHKVKKHIKTN